MDRTRTTPRRSPGQPRRFTFPDDGEPNLPGDLPGDDPGPPTGPLVVRPELAAQLVPFVVTSRRDVTVIDADDLTASASHDISFRVPTIEAPPAPPPDIDEGLENPIIPIDPDLFPRPIIVDGPILIDDDILIDHDLLQETPANQFRAPVVAPKHRTR